MLCVSEGSLVDLTQGPALGAQGLDWDSRRGSGTAGRRDSSGQTAVGQRPQQRSPSTTRQLLGAFYAHGWWPGPYRCNEHLLALLLGYLRASTRDPKSVDRATIETQAVGGGGSMRLAMDTARLVRMLAGCRFVGVRSSIRRPAVPDMAG